MFCRFCPPVHFYFLYIHIRKTPNILAVLQERKNWDSSQLLQNSLWFFYKLSEINDDDDKYNNNNIVLERVVHGTISDEQK